MLLHLDTLSWFRANQSLLLLLNAACLAEKQQMWYWNKPKIQTTRRNQHAKTLQLSSENLSLIVMLQAKTLRIQTLQKFWQNQPKVKLQYKFSTLTITPLMWFILNGNYKVHSYFQKMTDLFLCQNESLISVNIYYNCIFRIFYRNYWDCWIAPLLCCNKYYWSTSYWSCNK
jgi:hypothetical protein